MIMASDTYGEKRKVKVGICAMEKKSRSVPMKEITKRMEKWFWNYIEVIFFTDEQLLHQEIQKWPACDALIGWYSGGFPLSKAKAYQKLRQDCMFNLNDFEAQEELQDRSKVYKMLKKVGIEVPEYCVVNSKEGKHLEEFPDCITVNERTFTKPFVEKPRNAESHDVRIYFHSSKGGGFQQLFRKENDRSSSYHKEDIQVRNGNFIYEEFLQTNGRDIKVYAVGRQYAHAEARKSPALDGVVERNDQGNEIRYPVILTPYEKQIAAKIVHIFRQEVCGFDILRATNGKSYVCDVNGFSFVKSSEKYYDDAAKLLGNMILTKLASSLSIPWTRPSVQPNAPMLVTTTAGVTLELKCVIAVMRHGDRTPKQKKKVVVKDPKFVALFKSHGGEELKAVKLKKPADLQVVLILVRNLVEEAERKEEESTELKNLKLIRAALERHGSFSGINRKVQLKHNEVIRGVNAKGEVTLETSLLLIVKWGGELTNIGIRQAESLGKEFRGLYPGIEGKGFLRLHSTNRHDLKICASDEGRVQMTAAAFAKGLLALEGELPPILTLMVASSSKQDWMLNDDTESLKTRLEVKKSLQHILQRNKDFDSDDLHQLNSCRQASIYEAAGKVGNPWKTCQKIYDFMENLKESIHSSDGGDFAKERWAQLMTDFRKEKEGTVEFDISKIPDIYDNMRYDKLHNECLMDGDQTEFLNVAKLMNDIVVPQEYGILKREKLSVARRICTPLVHKMSSDLAHSVKAPDDTATILDPSLSHELTATPFRIVRTRLYVTSESHIHALLNLFIYGNLFERSEEAWENALNYLSEVAEYSYLSRLIVLMYEDPNQPSDSLLKHKIQLKFSPGVDEFGKHKEVTTLLPEISYGHIQEFFHRITAPSPSVEDVKPEVKH